MSDLSRIPRSSRLLDDRPRICTRRPCAVASITCSCTVFMFCSLTCVTACGEKCDTISDMCGAATPGAHARNLCAADPHSPTHSASLVDLSTITKALKPSVHVVQQTGYVVHHALLYLLTTDNTWRPGGKYIDFIVSFTFIAIVARTVYRHDIVFLKM
jgi:hypothetical protein